MSEAYRLSLLTVTTSGRLAHHPDGLLEVDGAGRIVYAGKFRPGAGKAEDLRGLLAIPGLVDAHCHLSQYPAVASDGLELLPWLKCHIFPLERSFRGEKARLPARRFFRELAAHGTTTAAVYTSIWPDSTTVCFEEAERSGMRVIMGKVMMDRGSYDSGFSAHHPGEKRGAVSLTQSEALCRVWHGRADGRLQYAFTPRFALSCSPRLMEGVGRLAARYGAYIQTHLSENKREVADVEDAFDRSYAEVYERAGLIGRRTILAHCIWLREAEFRILERRRPAVAHCPSSNAFLSSGVMDLGRLLKGKIPVALGSDVAGGPSLCLFTEMKQAIFAQRLAHASGLFEGPCPVTAEDAFSLATLDGARALGLEDRIGSLEAGKDADFVILDPADYEPEPGAPAASARDALSRMIYRAGRSSVRAAFVRGRKVFG